MLEAVGIIVVALITIAVSPFVWAIKRLKPTFFNDSFVWFLDKVFYPAVVAPNERGDSMGGLSPEDELRRLRIRGAVEQGREKWDELIDSLTPEMRPIYENIRLGERLYFEDEECPEEPVRPSLKAIMEDRDGKTWVRYEEVLPEA